MSLRLLQRFAAHGEIPTEAREAEALSLVELFRAQGLHAQLDEALLRSGHGWPEAAALVLRQAHRASLAHGTRLQDRAHAVLRRLRGAGLRVLPMKGQALLGDVYASPAERPMADADVLVLDGWEAALALLEQDGFVVRERAEHAWALEDPHGAGVLELHRGLCSCPELFPIDADGLWSRRVAANAWERPGTEDLLVQLAIHAAFQHGLQLRLGQYLDFRRLLEARSLDVALTLEIAASAQARACLLASLGAAEALVGAPFPEALRTALQERASRRLRKRVVAMRDAPLRLLASPSLRDLASWRFLLAGTSGLTLVAHTLRPRGGGALAQAARGARLLRQLVDKKPAPAEP